LKCIELADFAVRTNTPNTNLGDQFVCNANILVDVALP